MPDTFDISQQSNGPDAINAPASGVYGEGAALDRLKKQLPTMPSAPGAAPGPESPPVMPTPTSGPPAPAPGGLPASLMGPTTQPGVPVGTPLAGPAQQNTAMAAQNTRQRNIAILTAMVSDPRTSQVGKEWATNLLQGLNQQ